ncbi:MarC family NAAT transporter [Klebsiella aerogenes]|uniref:MarC family NAAT transporter n=1 Tax=Klebsiella aerogenes TaxID=548 RepID=UPI001F1B2DD5|nr:MarC family NAAT transporter [Klebsiella aerogenes]
MDDFFKTIGLGLLIILPIANPLFTTVLFLNLTEDVSANVKKRIAMKTAVNVFCIMLVAFYAGQVIINLFGISIPGLGLTGGLIVLYIGFRMLFPVSHPRESAMLKCGECDKHEQSGPGISFVPLAMPGTAGPGTISIIISLSSAIQDGGHVPSWIVAIAGPVIFLIISIFVWISLRASGAIMRVFGHGGLDAISRLMGLLLVSTGIQLIINNMHDVIMLWTS